ncbi:MAG: orotate phosphoribosyltransferase [Gammaproteobacteria bacterium RIFCSPHIGHO2_12_FULL_43_28]|nr:MAG: orotate phosphoribosyltransferase [Gammaproteobacteria bacterium RIFCSPHIGHO2_12_FULL_43_28]
MTNQALVFSLYEIGAIQFGEFKLKSGKTSTIYINLRKIISYPAILRAIAEAMWEKVSGCQFDLVCGVPYTALPIATCLSLTHNIPMIMRRKEKKDYGTKQLIEGEFKAKQRCLIIEDVITTGGSIIETAADLLEAGLEVRDLVALIDREQGGNENLSKQYRLHTLLTITEVLNTLLASDRLNASERKSIEQFLLEKSA